MATKWDRTKPALVIHAGDDQLIPIEQGRELAELSGAEFWEVPHRSHAQCQDCGKEYVDRIEGVMQEILRKDFLADHTLPGSEKFSSMDEVEKRAIAGKHAVR